MKTNDEWVKEFRKKFPYGGAIIEDDGTSYNFRDIEQFIQSQIDKARKEVIEEVEKEVEKASNWLLKNNENPYMIPIKIIVNKLTKLKEQYE